MIETMKLYKIFGLAKHCIHFWRFFMIFLLY